MRVDRIPLLLPACPHTELAFVPFFAYLWVSHNPEHHDRSTRDPPLPPQPPLFEIICKKEGLNFLGWRECFLFVGAGAWMILHASAAPSLAARYIIPVAGWLSILFFGTGAVALTVAALLRRRFPLVEVLPEGLKLHSILKPAKEYFFPWESIEAFSRVRIAGNDLLAVHTRDLAQRYDRSGPIGQIAIDISLSCSDTPYTINDRVLDAAPGEVERSLEEHLAAYRARSEREPAS